MVGEGGPSFPPQPPLHEMRPPGARGRVSYSLWALWSWIKCSPSVTVLGLDISDLEPGVWLWLPSLMCFFDPSLSQFQNWVGNVTGSFFCLVFLFFSLLETAQSTEVENGDTMNWTDYSQVQTL